MNQMESRKAQARASAKSLMDMLCDTKKVKGSEKGFAAIENILRAHAQGNDFDSGDIREMEKALCAPMQIEALHMIGKHGRQQWLHPVYGQLRQAAEILFRFLRDAFFLHDQGQPKMIAVCAKPGCGKLFVKGKSDQEFCSPQCRFAQWAKDKKEEDPGYFSEKTMRSRKIRNRRARKSAKG